MLTEVHTVVFTVLRMWPGADTLSSQHECAWDVIWPQLCAMQALSVILLDCGVWNTQVLGQAFSPSASRIRSQEPIHEHTGRAEPQISKRSIIHPCKHHARLIMTIVTCIYDTFYVSLDLCCMRLLTHRVQHQRDDGAMAFEIAHQIQRHCLPASTDRKICG